MKTSSNTGTQTNNIQAYNTSTTASINVSQKVNFEGYNEVHVPKLKHQNLSVHDDNLFSQQSHDQVTSE